MEVLDEWLGERAPIAGITDGGANCLKSLKDYDRYLLLLLALLILLLS